MSLFSKDTSIGEKIALLFPLALIAFLYASAFGVFHNFYSVAVAAAKPHALWFGLGGVLTVAWVAGFARAAKEGVRSTGEVVAIGAFMVLALLSFCGFAYPYVF